MEGPQRETDGTRFSFAPWRKAPKDPSLLTNPEDIQGQQHRPTTQEEIEEEDIPVLHIPDYNDSESKDSVSAQISEIINSDNINSELINSENNSVWPLSEISKVDNQVTLYTPPRLKISEIIDVSLADQVDLEISSPGHQIRNYFDYMARKLGDLHLSPSITSIKIHSANQDDTESISSLTTNSELSIDSSLNEENYAASGPPDIVQPKNKDNEDNNNSAEQEEDNDNDSKQQEDAGNKKKKDTPEVEEQVSPVLDLLQPKITKFFGKLKQGTPGNLINVPAINNMVKAAQNKDIKILPRAYKHFVTGDKKMLEAVITLEKMQE